MKSTKIDDKIEKQTENGRQFCLLVTVFRGFQDMVYHFIDIHNGLNITCLCTGVLHGQKNRSGRLRNEFLNG